MTATLAGIMITAAQPPIHCPGLPQRCPGPVPAGVRVVREEDATAFVLYAHQLLAAKGRKPVITPANERRLVWLGALMLAEFGIGGDTTEDSDG